MRTPQDLTRELMKICDVVNIVVRHFEAEAEMNAALHMAYEVRPAPLAIAVKAAYNDLERLIAEFSVFDTEAAR